ncbi:hypothetical protein ACFE04_007925 [Oxalis oulophora]
MSTILENEYKLCLLVIVLCLCMTDIAQKVQGGLLLPPIFSVVIERERQVPAAFRLIFFTFDSKPQPWMFLRSKIEDHMMRHSYCSMRTMVPEGSKSRITCLAFLLFHENNGALGPFNLMRVATYRKSELEVFQSSADRNFSQISLNPPNFRASVISQLMIRPKETVTGVTGPKVSFEKYLESVQPVSEFSKDHPKLCDICRRSETLLNPILVYYGCKVGVHLDCYRSVNETPGPWYCELCEESSSRMNSAPSNVFLCGGSTGAFRKSSGDHLVHAFCAEWVFETTFRSGQVNPVEGLEATCRGVDICRVCWRQNGICIRCNQGQCRIKFHPTCARSAGFYMTVKASDGKLQHKAYCDKHSLEQKAKGETQKHGTEELKTMKQVRPINLMRVATYRKSELEAFQSSADRNFYQQQGLMAWGKSRAHWNIIGKNVRVLSAIGATSAISAWSKIEYCNIHSVISQNEAKIKLLLGGHNVTENSEQIQETEKLLNGLLDVDAQI